MFTLSDLKKTKVYQEALAEGEQIGEAKGKEIGEKKTNLKAISNMTRLGLSLETIAKYLDLPLDEVKRLAKELKKGD
ncbi:MAG: Rpn family recombination-promoting nuclease/putative transposase [Moorea sp. SIO2B7]|nr:Rpn family recombination-promoting nuclease/putative transposase [Moorena sp. SIO2B7]